MKMAAGNRWTLLTKELSKGGEWYPYNHIEGGPFEEPVSLERGSKAKQRSTYIPRAVRQGMQSYHLYPVPPSSSANSQCKEIKYSSLLWS